MKMRKYIHYLLLSLSVAMVSCENALEPLIEGGRLTEEQLLRDPALLEGLLIKGYSALPNNYNAFNLDITTDNAVTNQQGSVFSAMATGAWSATFNPVSEWGDSYEQIRHLNLFLEKYQTISWAFDPRLSDADNAAKNAYILQRLKGEAHGLRAYFQYNLLRSHSGVASDGTLLGFPIITRSLSTSDAWQIPRNTFAECVQQIMSDIDTAIASLPPVYADKTGEPMYNAGLGVRFVDRMNGNAARALKSRVALLAASPAYSASSGVSWGQAATISGDLLKDLGALIPAGKTFYIYAASRPKEIIWEQSVVQSRTAEAQNFPPSLFGLGRTNPSQSLVDAFPMRNGYPKDHPSSGFDPENPYALRDVRLGDYILFNGSSFKSQTINTYVGAQLDGVGSLQTSTRTGYYLKKFMSPNVSLIPGSLSSAPHTYTLFRQTEVLLNFVEAANEAWGPDGDPNGYGFTAKSKLAELRVRAGITADLYLPTISDQADLRELIRNERRIELCFEGFRFWDIRRWENAAARITQPATGVLIAEAEGVFSYDYVTVEPRVYQPHMIYGPIPYEETLKYDLRQNAGW
jgi:starch-binding outer membrane protein, SusD/RagB family